MLLAKRMERVPPYIFAHVSKLIAEKRAQGVDVINLGIGSPDLPTPAHIVDVLKQAAEDPVNHGYPSYTGMPSFRQAVATWYKQRFDVDLDPDTEVVPLIGSKEGIAHLALAVVGPGDVALVPDPGYPTYHMGTVLADAESHPMPLLAENDFLPDVDAIPVDVLKRARVMWLNYPNNPTGAVAPTSFFEQLIDFASRHNLVIAHDNPYADITFDGYKAPSLLEVPGAKDVAVELNSLSKTYNMAGWRVGMAVGNANVIAGLIRVKSNVDTGIFNPIQIAASAALQGDQGWIADRNAVYQRRRDILLDGLAAVGLKAYKPKAALYIWVHTPDGWPSGDFSMHVLDQAGVWITPGTAYGEAGEGYMRLSLCAPEERLQEAMGRLQTTDF
ncbi:MAG: LL-diaminopimelate aminotransferase [Anaerolineae bacterium]